MDKKIVAFTFFTLFFFTVTAGRLPVDPPAANPSHIRLPREKARPDSDESNSTANHTQLLEPEKQTNFTRLHLINRHFHGKPPRPPKPIGAHRRPYRKPVTQNSKVTDNIKKTDDSNWETFGGEVPTDCLMMKQYYGSRRHRSQPRDNKNVVKTKYVFDREKVKSLMREHKKKKSVEESGIMKNIRKFLKHNFD